jgi:hypothetical protein
MTRVRKACSGAVLIACTALLLSGCVAAPAAGVVAIHVQVGATADNGPLDITIRDRDHNVIDHERLMPGISKAFANVPYGRTMVTAAGLCTLQSTLSDSNRRLSVLFEEKHCTI